MNTLPNVNEPLPASDLFGGFALSDYTMTEAQQRHIQDTGCCPRPGCQPREGVATPMRSLGPHGTMGWMHCLRCDTVWVVSPPNAEVSDGGPLTHDKPAAQSRRSLH
jgi:hypothetical protein